MLHDNKVKLNYVDEVLELLSKKVLLSPDDNNHRKYL